MKLDVGPLRYISKEDFAVLSAIEMGSRNHEVVPISLVSRLSKMRPGGVSKAVCELQKLKLVTKDDGAYQGVILGYGGYDYLALRTFSGRGTVAGVGRQIGVGKESDIYEVCNETAEYPCIIKIQRLGRTSFRTIKNNRDYIGKRQHYSWLYLSKLAATKEYAFMTALHQHNFPVPRPVDHSRHVIVMEEIIGKRLEEIRICDIPGDSDDIRLEILSSMGQECLNLIVRLAQHGLIHGDFNEFNLLIEQHTSRIVMIDFPQMVSIHHPNSVDFFDRDVDCICQFFDRRFGISTLDPPNLDEILQLVDLDKQLKASGNKHRPRENDDEEMESELEEDFSDDSAGE